MTALTLPQDFEAWAKNEVESGRASDVAEVARAAFDDYRRRRDAAQLEAFRRTLDEASAAADRGEVFSAAEVFSELRARIRARDWRCASRSPRRRGATCSRFSTI